MVSITAVVPSAGRPQLLDRCLRGLAKSAAELDEVVIVHDGDDATLAVLKAWSDSLRIKEFRGTKRGASARRNEAVIGSDSDVIAFTDDDCEPAPGWASGIRTTFDVGDDVDLVSGPVLPHPDDAAVTGTFARTLRMESASDLYAGANMSIRRSALDRVGGWDETMAGGEDTDLAWRVIETAKDPAAASKWSEPALVWHAVRAVSFKQHLTSLPRWSSLPLVIHRHPQLRRNLTAGVFWKPEHITAAAALAAIALSPIDKRAAALAVPHLIRRIKPHGVYRGLELTASDLTELVVLIVGSARHGSLLL